MAEPRRHLLAAAPVVDRRLCKTHAFSSSPARLELTLLDPPVARGRGIRESVELPRSPGLYRTNGPGQVCAARRYPNCQAAKCKTGAALLSHGRGKPGAPRP